MNTFTYRGRSVEIVHAPVPYLSEFCLVSIDGKIHKPWYTSEEIAEREARAMIDFELDGAWPPRADEDESIEGGRWME